MSETETKTRFDEEAIVAALTNEEEYEADGWTFVLKLEPDEDGSYDSMEDPAVFGSIALTRHGDPRPDGFDGSAEKLHLGNYHPMHDDVWYLPPPDFKRFKGSGFGTVEEWTKRKAEHRQYVWDILVWGYNVWVVEATHVRDDGYQREWSQAIGGIEAMTGPDDYPEAVADLVHEILSEIEQEEATA